MENPLDGGFKLCDEVTTLNSITNFGDAANLLI